MRIKGRTLAALFVIAIAASSLLTFMAAGTQDSVLGKTVYSFLDKVGIEQPKQDPDLSSIPASEKADFEKVYSVYQMIQQNYLEKVDDKKLVDGAIKGMMDSLGDPYSTYMDQEATQQFNDSIHSSFQGIGATVTMEGGKVTIEAPIKGSPAEKAGLQPHDQIVSVNGEKLDGLDLFKAVSKIRGPKGTKAKLEIIRPGMKSALTVVVVRDDIPIETVYSETIKKDGKTFGKIEVTQFSTNTGTRFKEELDKLEKQKVDGLLIDLRGNPGGLLNVVVDMASQLIPDKGIILQVEDPSGKRDVIRSSFEGKKPYPIVVLIDQGSASASEIFAGAMKESGGYELVGHKSFGKGTVQNTVELPDKSQVKMTIAKWLTPSGTWIHKKGIEPDVKIEEPKYFLAAPIVVDKEPLKFDKNSEAVRNLQLILDGLGVSPGRSDGYFDEKTAVAVKAFQKLHNLPVTGEVDQKTAEQLKDALVKKIKDPANDMQLQAAIQVLLKETKK